MKSKNFRTALLAGAILCLSCAKQADPEIPSASGEDYIVATLSGVKTTLAKDGKTPLWAAGDKIALYSSDKTPVRREITLVSSGTPSDSTGVIAEGGASFTFCRPASMSGDIYAIHPASAGTGFKDSIQFSIPQTQYGSFSGANICSGKVVDKTISFKNLTAVLEFNLASEVTKVVVSPDGGKTPYTLIPDKEKNAGNLFYMAVPAITISNGFAKYYAGDLVVGGKERTAQKTLAVNTLYKVTQSSVVKFSGLFSVSESSKVRFTLGNLYHEGSLFKIEQHQYDVPTWTTEKCGLFYFSRIDSVSYALDYDDEEEGNYDRLFTNGGDATPKATFVAAGVRGSFRTLSNLEWIYLIAGRAGADDKCATGTVAGVHGLILLPDSFTDPKPDGISFQSGFAANWSRNTYTAKQWDDSMQTAGAVFLPAASSRQGASVIDPGADGYYWTSEAAPYTNDASSAYGLYFGSLSCQTGSYIRPRDYGCSVRLVQNAK